MPVEQLLRTWRGTRLDRSGDVQIIPEEPNFVSGGLTHAGPWDYLQEVPLFLYGPGYVRPGVYERDATLADIAPTVGRLLGFDFDAPDGRTLTEAVPPAAGRPPPRLVITLVWDAAGRNVLEAWPDDWPFLSSLIPQGAWYANASVGSSPSNTPPGHATIGTGAFPDRHGMVDEYIRMNGQIQKPNANGPAFLLRPTLADLYDRARENRPIVGGVATLSAHLMMMGHGAQWGGGDRDIAVAREKEVAPTGGAEDLRWGLTTAMAPFYELPPYVNRVPGFEGDVRTLDQADGALDGTWRGNSIAQLKDGFDTPARTPYQTRLIEEVIRREGFGRDEVPDLLFLNYKAIDTVGHLFSVNSLEMSETLAVQDRELRVLTEFLDREVGGGRWVLVLTADHGHQFDPGASGAFQIGIDQVEARITATLDDGDDVPLIQKLRPTEVWLNREELRENGYSLVDVSRLITRLTKAETVKPNQTVAPGEEDDRVFAAAFPSSILGELPCLQAMRSGPA